MEDIFVTKIIETEIDAKKIILEASESANNMMAEYKLNHKAERKRLEQKYDDMVSSEKEKIKAELDDKFNSQLSQAKSQIEKIKLQSKDNYDKALKLLLTGESDYGNS